MQVDGSNWTWSLAGSWVWQKSTIFKSRCTKSLSPAWSLLRLGANHTEGDQK